MSDGSEQRSKVTRTGTYAAAPDALWALVRDFGGIDKIMPGLEGVEVEGKGLGQVRRIPAAKGGVVVESLDVFDDEARILTYSIVEAPLPFRDYSATMVVSETEGGGSQLTWTGSFFADGIPVEKAERLAGNIYAGGIAGYRAALGEDG
jgi:hypothetical protein